MRFQNRIIPISPQPLGVEGRRKVWTLVSAWASLLRSEYDSYDEAVQSQDLSEDENEHSTFGLFLF